MKQIFLKTFCGLSWQYYFRQFFFGLIAALFVATFYPFLKQYSIFPRIQELQILALIINTLLYPYSRFVYEGVISFIFGENIFFGNAIVMLTLKIVTMSICWILASIIAPIGLIFLFFYHSKNTS